MSQLIHIWAEGFKLLDEKSEKQWKVISEFASPRHNYKAYRVHLSKLFSSRNISVLPYLGLYLKDLTFIEEGNSSFDDSGAVNFFKMRMFANVITEVQKAQSSSFNFKKNPELLSYLTCGIQIHDEDHLWNLSYTCQTVSSSDSNTRRKRHSLREQLSDMFKPKNEEEIINSFSNPIFQKRASFDHLASINK